MARYSVVLAMLLTSALPAWASPEGFFEDLTRDFGTVPRGPVLSHPFRLVNKSNQPVVINNVRVSCGCVSARALQTYLKPGEETAILVTMDTGRFSGVKSVQVWVTFVQPHFEEVRLWVQANSRDDVAVTPEAIDFGKLKRGAASTTSVNVSFFNNINNEITEVRCDSNYLLPACKLVRRDSGEVTYQLSATLRVDTPVGKWFTDVWLKTNNPAIPKVRVPLAVEIAAPPAPLAKVAPATTIPMGQVKVGAETTHKLVIRGSLPFRVIGITGTDAQIQVRDGSADNENIHVLIVTLRPNAPGDFQRLLRVQTDLQTGGAIDFIAEAKVMP